MSQCTNWLLVTGFLLACATPSGVALAQVEEAWVARYDRPGDSRDYLRPSALALDSSGNVYVTGWDTDSSDSGATVKYDPEGNELWVAESGFSLYAIALDAAGNVYAAGSVRVEVDSQLRDYYATVKYDREGNELWVARYGWDENVRISARSVAVDADGNAYVTGTSGTIKYDADGNELRVDGTVSALALDAAGNVYVAGTNGLVKYDADGNELWVAGTGLSAASALALDAAGNVYVLLGSGTDYTTVKYGPEGEELWVVQRKDTFGGVPAHKFAVDSSGNVYVTGSSGTIKYDANGNEAWVAGGPEYFTTALALDSAGNVYVTGQQTVKHDPEGNELWAAYYDGSGVTVDDIAWALAIDSAGNVYVTGEAAGSTGFGYRTVKYVQTSSPFLRGDCNDDGTVDISDAVFSLGSLFLGEDEPGCDDACDSNDDGAIDISDAINTLGVLFLGNGVIPLPGMTVCGVDPTADDVGCETFSRCP